MSKPIKKTQERIIEAALFFAKTEGWKNTTVRKICARAEVSIGSFYHHFKSKQEVVNYSFMLFDNLLLKNPPQKDDNPIDSAKDLLMKQAKFIVDEAGKVTAEYYATLLVGEDGKAVSTNRVYYKYLLGYLEDANKAKMIKKEFTTEYVAKFLIKFVRGSVIDWAFHNYDYDCLAVLDKELDMIISNFIV